MIGQRRGAPREHVLIPIGATANGRLHLGHIGGPMLKVDVLARHLVRGGDRATVVSSTDPYDSFVLIRSRETGQTPEQTVEHWHPLIERDLNAVGIVPDRFINLADEPWRTRYHQISQDIMRDLHAQGLVTSLAERFPYCVANSQYIIGGFLHGECPHCRSATAGYFCEQCGLLFRPEMVMGARCGLDGCTPDWRSVACLYARLPDPDAVMRWMKATGVPDEYHRVVETYMRVQGPLLRLTQPGTWGVPWPVEGSPVPQVTFNYVVGVLAFWLLCAETGADGSSALYAGSTTHTVASFGYDNSLPFLLGGQGIAMALPRLKPVDHVLLNHFMTLDGSKFSTSRNHVIWAGDLAGAPGVGSDAIRAYLTSHSPDCGSTDFSRQGFTAFCDTVLRGRWRAAVDRAWQYEPTAGALSTRLAERLDELLAAQERALDPTDHNMPAMMTAVHAWVDYVPTPEDAHWWLKGFALLAYPILPEFGMGLWRALGMTGSPVVERFTQPAQGPRALAPPTIGQAS
jgi:methionyl-tRNA synthetase